MSEIDTVMEAALLKIAKDLLQASDDLAATDPSSSAKLAHEAYEIGRDLGIVRDHLDEPSAFADGLSSSSPDEESLTPHHGDLEDDEVAPMPSSYRQRPADDEADAGLSRILDRQRAMLPKPLELPPVRKASRGARPMTFEATPPRRSGWFGWMRPREWRHAG